MDKPRFSWLDSYETEHMRLNSRDSQLWNPLAKIPRHWGDIQPEVEFPPVTTSPRSTPRYQPSIGYPIQTMPVSIWAGERMRINETNRIFNQRQTLPASSPEGVYMKIRNPLGATSLGLIVGEDCIVEEISDPKAYQSGWAIGDKIVQINDVDVTTLDEFTAELPRLSRAFFEMGKAPSFVIWRARRGSKLSAPAPVIFGRSSTPPANVRRSYTPPADLRRRSSTPPAILQRSSTPPRANVIAPPLACASPLQTTQFAGASPVPVVPSAIYPARPSYVMEPTPQSVVQAVPSFVQLPFQPALQSGSQYSCPAGNMLPVNRMNPATVAGATRSRHQERRKQKKGCCPCPNKKHPSDVPAANTGSGFIGFS